MIKPALIVVDLQREFVKPNPDFLSNVKNLVNEWPPEDVYWMRYFNHPESMFVKYLDWFEAIDSPEAGLIWWEGVEQTNLIDHYGYGIPKKHMEKLIEKYRGTVVIGADTDACVLSTMFGLWDNDIKPTLLTEYCLSSGGQDYHDCALKLMMRQFGPRCVIDGIKTYKDFI